MTWTAKVVVVWLGLKTVGILYLSGEGFISTKQRLNFKYFNVHLLFLSKFLSWANLSPIPNDEDFLPNVEGKS